MQFSDAAKAGAANGGAHLRPIYYFDIVDDYPEIGGVVEFSRILFAQLRKRYGRRLISVREAVARLGCRDDAAMPYLDRERRAAELLACADPDSTFFYPNFQSPIARAPGSIGPRIINVIHDVQFAFLPELFSASRLRWLYQAFAETGRNADQIVFISRAAQEQFIGLFGAPRRYQVIYNPVEIEAAGPVQADDDAPFLLASVHHHPHKNFRGLLALFAELAERSPDLTLRVTGHGSDRFAKDMAVLPEALRHRVRHLGYVPRRELDGLYRRARAFITLSRFEGFNLSAAEAASHGTPLILSDLPVHRELFSGQACFVDPLQPSVEKVLAFLARDRAGQRWPLRATCMPSAVGRSYARAIDSLNRGDVLGWTPRCRVAIAPSHPPVPPWMQAVPQSRPKSFVRNLLATSALIAVSAALAATITAGPVLGDGGAGGGVVGAKKGDPPLPGPLGGTGYTGEHGEDASAGSVYFGGGGGGAGGGNGGKGAPRSCGPSTGCPPDEAPGSGGAGGTAANPNGEAGGLSTPEGGGGGGGGGGFHGNGWTGVLGGADLTGGNGGDGGMGGHPSKTGSGGGGGAGGYGAVVTATGDIRSAITIAGGNGGTGGSSPLSFAGSGGDGGVGIFFAQSGVVFTNSGIVTGGNGGAGGSSASGYAGNGGHGGVGIFFAQSGVVFTNSGNVTGGDGGAAGLNLAGTQARHGAPGLGGAGIVGGDLLVINSGSITGGWSGDGTTQADAITFIDGTNALRFTDTTSGLSGNIGILAGTLSFDQSAIATTVDNAITGGGSIIKSGDGTITLTGVSTYTGTTSVNGGLLVVNGSIASSSGLTVESGGITGGSGYLPSTVVRNGGVHAPGNSIGTQTVDGDYTIGDGGILEIEVDGAGQSDRVNVTGGVNLDGGILRVVVEGGSTPVPGTYLIIDNQGLEAVSGSFAQVTNNLAFFNSSIIYDGGDGNDVVLQLSRVAFRDVAASANQRAVANALEQLASDDLVLVALLGQTEAGAQQMFVELSGEHAAGIQQASFQSMSLFLNTMLEPFRKGDGGGTAKSAPDKQPWNIWGAVLGSHSEADGALSVGSSDARIGTVAFASGVDFRISPDSVVGAAVAVGQNRWKVSGSGSGDADVAEVGGYGTMRLGNAYISGAIAGGWYDAETSRHLVINGIDHLAADFRAHSIGGRGETGYRFGGSSFGLTPYAALQMQWLSLPGYREDGGAAALSYAGQTVQDTRTELGLWIDSHHLLDNGAHLRLRARGAWMHDFEPGRHVTAAFQSQPGASFTIDAADAPEDAALLSLAADLQLGAGLMLSAQFGSEFSDRSDSYAGSATLRLAW